MKKNLWRVPAAALLALASLAVASVATASCSVGLNQDVLDAVNPPAHQLRLVYGDNDFTDIGEVTLRKTYTAQGEAETLTLTNRKGSAVTITSVAVRDTARFALSLPAELPQTVESGASFAYTVSFSSEEEGSFSTPMTVAYSSGGKTRKLIITIKATRTMSTDNVAVISILDSANAQITSNDPAPYDFGYSNDPIDKVFTVRNTGGNALSISNIICSNETAYSVLTSPVGTVAPGGSAILTVRRLNGRIAATATITLVSNAVNIPSFRLNVSSRNFASGALTVVDPKAATFTEGVSPCYDLGYSASAINRTFTLRNTGVGTLTVYSLSSSNAASISVSEGPAPSETIAEGGQRTFTLSLGAASPATTATITITTSDPLNSVFTLPVSGGNAALNVNFTGKVAYRLSPNCYDFGWQSGATTRNIVLTNNAPSPLALDRAVLSVPGAFVVGTLPASIPSGESANVPVTFTPVNATTWSETVCTLYDEYDRTYSLYLTGSGFRQPSDIGVAPALWLRADRIASTNIVNVDSKEKVDLWPDVSGNGFHAQPVTISMEQLRPVYNPTGINGYPSLTYSGVSSKECMQIVPTGGLINTSTGTTTFIVFKTGPTIDSTRYLLYSYNSTYTYPTLGWGVWYYDPDDGYYAGGASSANRAMKYRFNLYGYNAVVRNPVDSASNPVAINTCYKIGMIYDISKSATNDNIGMVINNVPISLGYLHSNQTGTSGITGAFGLPVGDGLGGKRSDVGLPKYAEDYANALASNSALLKNCITVGVSPLFHNSYIPSLYIGGTSSGAGNFYGEIAEVIMFAAPLNDTNYGYVNTYLRDKYGL